MQLWLSVDPLVEEFPEYSPYNFVFNNPLNMIDPDGRAPDWHRDGTGALVADKGDTAKTLASYKGISVQEARAEFNQNHYHFESTMRGGETFNNSDRYVASGAYGPDKDPTHAAIAAGAVVLPVLAVSGGLAAGGAYLWSEGAAAFGSMTWGSSAFGIATNTISQGIANGGDFTQVNVIEAGLSAIPGVGATIAGETFSLSVENIMEKNYTPSIPSFEQGVLQIGGGLLSNKFGGAVDGSSVFKQGVGKTYGEVSKFAVETASNVAPKLVDDKSKK